MRIENETLWRALAGMRIAPESAALRFESRLGREQGWSRARTEAVMEEYRRFLYLAATGSRPVSPSKAVDEAWHLHLTYTRHYWDELCGRILGRPLHHEPSEGGAAQGDFHREQYRLTLEAYRATFGEDPPADIWPNLESAGEPQPQPQPGRAALRFGRAAAALSLLAACTALTAAAEADGEDNSLLGFIIIGAFVALLIFFVKKAKRRRGGGRGRRAGAAGGAYGGYDASDDRNDHDFGSSDSDGGSSCGGGCGGGGD